MEKYSKILIILIILDMLSTILALTTVPGSKELNPFISSIGNVYINIVISHILGIIIVIWISRLNNKNKLTNKEYKISFTILNILFFIAFINNTLGTIYNYILI